MNTLNIRKYTSEDLIKKLFKFKPFSTKYLILTVVNDNNGRFKLADFHCDGRFLALVDNSAQIFIIDFLHSKCWRLPKSDSCTIIKFLQQNDQEILVGKSSGIIELIDTDSGQVRGKLLGHQEPVISISLTSTQLAISSSNNEAIMWDLSTCSKLQVLCLEKQCELKFVIFLPISNNILVCYKDDVIQIWQNGTLDNLKQFHPSNWRNYTVRSLSISRNGKILIVSGFLPILVVFQLNIWRLLKIINLPSHINTVKKVKFVPQSFDGGANKILAILTGNGLIYFYDLENNLLISELKSKCEIADFSVACSSVQYMACILCSGEIEVYDVNFYIEPKDGTVFKKADDITQVNKKIKYRKSVKKLDFPSKLQMAELLETDKLRAIIKEYQEFPKSLRATIWERLLKLPINTQHYNSIVNHVSVATFEDLSKKYPVEDKVSIRCLKHLLDNLASWCPFFAQVDYLPYLLYPFVKVFHKKPIACFELACTFIINWCQHWFEYFPLPPINILAIIDNILMEHNFILLQHFTYYTLKPTVYSWSLLETAFSEVLNASDWLKFFDHVFVNPPCFLLCAVVAFLLIHQKNLVLLTQEEELYEFIHTQQVMDFKKFIAKCYFIFNNTSTRNHPRQYLSEFECLNCGTYPIFEEYPRDVINFQIEHLDLLDQQLNEVKELNRDVKLQKQNDYNDVELKQEENKRRIEVEKACIEKIKAYQEHLMLQQEELKKLRQELSEREKMILENSKKLLKKDNVAKWEVLKGGLEMSQNVNMIEGNNIEEAYKLEQLNLERKARLFETSSDGDASGEERIVNALSAAQHDIANYKNELENSKFRLKSPRKVNVALTISSMNGLIKKIRTELERDSLKTNYYSIKENLKMLKLEKETGHLQKEVSSLLKELNKQHDQLSNCSSICSSTSCSSKSIKCPSKTVRFSSSGY
ncbi:hypothetical protein ABEB36_002908 [Hypothenemus hampei]|uniref:TBC1 domain family member 31 n=1 Tax=Hypothenemus hampei TaxID=57062 RepID=A0ABD1F7D2_HYPHA